MRPLLIAALCIATPLGAQETCAPDAMIVFDGSGSMAELGFNQIGEPRIFEARQAMRRALPPIARNRNLGLIVYGPDGADECTGVVTHFAPQPDAAEAIIATVDALVPEGGTALTQAVRTAADVLDHRNRAGAIVVVTDGKETCGGAPCRLATELATESLDLTVHVIGFKVRGEHFAWQSEGASDYSDAVTVSRCLADETGGHYVSAETLDDLITALEKTLGCNVFF